MKEVKPRLLSRFPVKMTLLHARALLSIEKISYSYRKVSIIGKTNTVPKFYGFLTNPEKFPLLLTQLVFKQTACRLVQWNPALRTPALYGQFRLSRQKAHIFSLKLTRFIRTPVNTDNGHFSVSRVTNSHILSTPLYGHWLAAHCLFSLSQLSDNCRHCTLFK